MHVPAGKFKYGNGKQQLKLNAFQIARYPITNVQYQCFIDDHGYETDMWWQGLANRSYPKRATWNYSNHPRETVCWFEAMAFCKWLDSRLRARGDLPPTVQIRLPTEQEWEKAARGTNGRAYPWGDFRNDCTNIRETENRLGQTSPVGIFPHGVSPYGALDMSGNVWEWCLNKYDDPSDTSPCGEDRRVLRGGSWDDDQPNSRCASRFVNHPVIRNYHLGFRLVRASPMV